MEVRVSLALKAVLKSMNDVVLPAVDPDNKLAQEQANLVVALLSVIEQRQPYSYEYDVDELRRLIGLASDLQSLQDAPALNSSIADAEEVLLNARVSPERLTQTRCQLSAVVADQVEALTGADNEFSHAAAKTVLAAAREQTVRERAWLIDQGWESEPEQVPAIETLIGFGELAGKQKA